MCLTFGPTFSKVRQEQAAAFLAGLVLQAIHPTALSHSVAIIYTLSASLRIKASSPEHSIISCGDRCLPLEPTAPRWHILSLFWQGIYRLLKESNVVSQGLRSEGHDFLSLYCLELRLPSKYFNSTNGEGGPAYANILNSSLNGQQWQVSEPHSKQMSFEYL